MVHSELLKRALSELPHLTSLDLNPNCHEGIGSPFHPTRPAQHERVFTAFNTFPSSLIARLTTLALHNMSFVPADLRTLLQDLTSARHITLDRVTLAYTISGVEPGTANYCDLLYRLCAHYASEPEYWRRSIPVLTLKSDYHSDAVFKLQRGMAYEEIKQILVATDDYLSMSRR